MYSNWSKIPSPLGKFTPLKCWAGHTFIWNLPLCLRSYRHCISTRVSKLRVVTQIIFISCNFVKLRVTGETSISQNYGVISCNFYKVISRNYGVITHN